ncbi:response regulator [Nitrospinae bacterium AH_259_B05_G02_I21]|nr:response regulator [Nitrospinae bacterium AH_259_B05_G02_I21]MDA2932667.1 response regulator [Nitrospinae bacterium AH-259-F20]
MSSTILVVDDEPSVCKALCRFLVDKGYGVVEAHDGDQALSAYSREKPNVVLLDVRMPGKDGLETLRELKAIDPEASVIMVTAVYEKKVALQAIANGAFDYVTKPIDYDYLELALVTKLALIGNS